jgi:hypothetical protein
MNPAMFESSPEMRPAFEPVEDYADQYTPISLVMQEFIFNHRGTENTEGREEKMRAKTRSCQQADFDRDFRRRDELDLLFK